MSRFDGVAEYEHGDPRRGWHPDWGSFVFDYGRSEVRNFLVANALYWMLEFHADGIRVDGVASMLYLDYSRKEGEWTPNVYGGRENLEAIGLLQEINATAYKSTPGVVTVAEESTAWPGVTRPTDAGGLGFRVQVEHGLDARHACLPGDRADLPALSPPRDDLPDGVRLQRELRAAAVARRGRARQGLPAAQDARRPLAAARHPACLLRLHVGAAGQEAAVHGFGVRPGHRVGRVAQPRLVAARRRRRTSGCTG